MTSAAEPRAIDVLVVDDSAVVRQALAAILGGRRGISVRTAADPLIAQRKVRERRPDVIVLDLEMPRMDGLTYLRMVMSEDPVPVVVCSGTTKRGSESAIRALELGAVGIVEKPSFGVREFLRESAAELTEAVRGASEARLPRPFPRSPYGTPEAAPAEVAATGDARIVAIGASMGGTEALRTILTALPVEAPPILVVQHMPAAYTAAFAARLNEICAVEIREATDGEPVVSGRALIAPGGRHLELSGGRGAYRAAVGGGPAQTRHRPSVDVLFRSVARKAGAGAVGVLLTGMGADGADGLLAMREAGAATVAQDEESCVVFGMPREAIARGAAGTVASLSAIPALVLHLAISGRGDLAARSQI